MLLFPQFNAVSGIKILLKFPVSTSFLGHYSLEYGGGRRGIYECLCCYIDCHLCGHRWVVHPVSVFEHACGYYMEVLPEV